MQSRDQVMGVGDRLAAAYEGDQQGTRVANGGIEMNHADNPAHYSNTSPNPEFLKCSAFTPVCK